VQSLAEEAQVRHYSKWPILSKSVGAPEVDSQPATYSDQVLKFSNWIKTRISWLDANMPGKLYNPVESEHPNFSYRIFPNPASDIVYIETSSEINEIEVFHSSGERVIHLSGMSVFETQLIVSNLTSGIYAVRIKMHGKPTISSKLVIR
jgi:hypothetical protein